MTINLRYSDINTTAHSVEKCHNKNVSLASVKCIHRYLYDTKGNLKQITGIYDLSTLKLLQCSNGKPVLDQILLLPGSNSSRNANLSNLFKIHTNLLTPNQSIASISKITDSLSVYSERKTKLDAASLTDIILFIDKLFVALKVAKTSSYISSSSILTLSSRLLDIMNTILKCVHILPGERVKIVGIKVIIELTKVGPTRIKRQAIENDNNGIVFHLSSNKSNSNTDYKISVPSSSITEATKQLSKKNVLVYASLMNDPSLFNDTANLSGVVTVGTESTLTSNFSFDITFPEKHLQKSTDNQFQQTLHQTDVLEWEYKALKWQVGECSRLRNKGNHSFQCTKLASYAALFSSRIIPSNFSLSIVSYLGCGTSTVCLLITLLIYMVFRDLHKKPTTPTLVNICATLAAVYIFYMASAGMTSLKAACDAVTFLLHFSILACFSWMAVNTIQMYKAFTKVSTIKRNITSIYIYLLAYGIPFCIAFTTFCVTALHLDHSQDYTSIFVDSTYRLRYACMLSGPSLYWGLLLPIGIILAFNSVMFVVLIKSIFFKKREIRSSAKKTSIKDQLVNAIALSTLMGLTWIFGYMLLFANNIIYQSIFQWLFTGTNVFQGIVFFWLSCVRRETIRKIWIPDWFIRCFTATCKSACNHDHHEPNENTVGLPPTAIKMMTTDIHLKEVSKIILKDGRTESEIEPNQICSNIKQQ